MPDEVGTMTTSPDTPGVDDNLFDDAADDKPARVVEWRDSEAVNAAEQQGSGDAEKQVTGNKAGQDQKGSDEAKGEAIPSNDLKVVVSIRGGRATIGVQRPSADPHIETFDDPDLPGLAEQVPAVTERARVRWEEAPKHPSYARPVPPAKRRNRRQQGASQDSTGSGAETEQAQQQTLQLF